MSRAFAILIVDDDEDYRSTLSEVLESEGCWTYGAENGRRALEVLEVFRPDLVVVDLMMPAMNGWDLCFEMDQNPLLANIPRVIVSAVARFRPMGQRRVLPKPLGINTVIALLDIVESLKPATC